MSIDDHRIDLPVANHDIHRKIRPGAHKRIVQEQHRIEMTLSRQQVHLIAQAKTVVLSIGGEPFPLTQAQIYLFAGIDARLTMYKTHHSFQD